MIHEIVHATHRVVMITGDGPLTACHVAKELDFFGKSSATVLVTQQIDDQWFWQSIDQETQMDIDELNIKDVVNKT